MLDLYRKKKSISKKNNVRNWRYFVVKRIKENPCPRGDLSWKVLYNSDRIVSPRSQWFSHGESCHRASFAWWPTVRLCLESISSQVRHLRRVDAYNVTVIADDWRTTLTDTVHYRIIVESSGRIFFSNLNDGANREFLSARECFLLVAIVDVDEKGGRVQNRCNDERSNRFTFVFPRFNNKSR